MLRKVVVKLKSKKINLKVKNTDIFSRFSGLMFKTKNTDNLVFDFDKNVRYSIHSYFVFFPFLSIWLDKKNKVLHYEIVKPFSLSIRPKMEFRKIVELPFNDNNVGIIRKFVKKI